MPLKPSHVLQLLNTKRSDFNSFDKTVLQSLTLYRQALANAAQESPETLIDRLTQHDTWERGAEPLEPSDTGWIRPFGLKWPNREESLAWVKQHLTGVSTFAVDGSQIYPGKDLSIPVALVQIGWFENFHQPNGLYEKDIAVDVMTPAELKVLSSGDPVDRRVNMRRFEMEVDRLIQYMSDRAGYDQCLAFFDGSLVATFADAFDEATRNFYIRCLVRLLQASETHRIPLVGYIDTSYSGDVALMLQRLYELPEAAIQDAPLMAKGMQWGDRTPLMQCRRPGVLQHYPARTHRIGFTYLKAHDGFPVRLEMPLWVYEAGLLETVMNWVRGEIVIGSGYPYAIETADQTAVLQAGDRQLFYRILQDWADAEDLNLRLSRKMVSKARRR